MMTQESGARLAGLMVEQAAERRRKRQAEERERSEAIVESALRNGREIERRELQKEAS